MAILMPMVVNRRWMDIAREKSPIRVMFGDFELETPRLEPGLDKDRMNKFGEVTMGEVHW
jgi:hypothetical protein